MYMKNIILVNLSKDGLILARKKIEIINSGKSINTVTQILLIMLRTFPKSLIFEIISPVVLL